MRTRPSGQSPTDPGGTRFSCQKQFCWSSRTAPTAMRCFKRSAKAVISVESYALEAPSKRCTSSRRSGPISCCLACPRTEAFPRSGHFEWWRPMWPSWLSESPTPTRRRWTGPKPERSLLFRRPHHCRTSSARSIWQPTANPSIRRAAPRVSSAACARSGGWRPSIGDSMHLTSREREIVVLIDRGCSNKDIARRLGIEVATVKNHVYNILEKLHARRGAMRPPPWSPVGWSDAASPYPPIGCVITSCCAIAVDCGEHSGWPNPLGLVPSG